MKVVILSSAVPRITVKLLDKQINLFCDIILIRSHCKFSLQYTDQVFIFLHEKIADTY